MPVRSLIFKIHLQRKLKTSKKIVTRNKKMEPWAVFSLSTSVWSSSLRWKERCIWTFIESRFAAVSARADSFFHEAGFSSDVYRERILALLFLHINGTKGLMSWSQRVKKFGNPLIQGKNLSKLVSYIYSRWTRWSNEMLEQGQSFLNLIQTIDASFHSSKYNYRGFLF